MLALLFLLSLGVSAGQLTDLQKMDNPQIAEMPLDRLVYLSIKGQGTITVEAKRSGVTHLFNCESPSDRSFCVLWTAEHHLFGSAKKEINEKIQLKIKPNYSSGHLLQFKLESADHLELQGLSSSHIQLNGAKHLTVAYPSASNVKHGLHISLTSLTPHKADYLNRLTLETLGNSNLLATDASGRTAAIHLDKSAISQGHLKVSSELGSSIHLAFTDKIREPIIEDRRAKKAGFLKFFNPAVAGHLSKEESLDPKFDRLADNSNTHWLNDGATEFLDLKTELTIGKTVGEGHFGIVKEVYDKKLKVDGVAKFIKKSRKMDEENGAVEVNNEVKILNKLPVHVNVCRFYRAFETRAYVTSFHQIVMVLENCGKTSMYKRYTDKKATEGEVRYFLSQIVDGQLALHKAGVYQIDIKLTNMMVTRQGVLKIIDFGLATLDNSKKKGKVGAEGYATPEMILHKPYLPSMVDPWNDGIIIYKMLYGVYCFGGNRK